MENQVYDILNMHKYMPAIIGGVLIAFSSSLNLLLKGRITGMSGILFNILTLTDFFWRIVFVLAMLWVTSLLKISGPEKFELFENPQINTENLPLLGFIICGFLVGLGTKLANGCTSGHGVCGLPRFSKRSIISVLIFCFVGIMTATLNYYLKLSEKFLLFEPDLLKWFFEKIDLDFFSHSFHLKLFYVLSASLVLTFILGIVNDKTIDDFMVSFLSGSLFGAGLIISGMNKRSKVLGFLTISKETFDPSLIFVLASAVGMNLIFFNFIIKVLKKPVFSDKLTLPTRQDIDYNLILGSIIFGIGWGLGGICPGPAITSLTLYYPKILIFIITFFIGQILGSRFEKTSYPINNNKLKAH